MELKGKFRQKIHKRDYTNPRANTNYQILIVILEKPVHRNNHDHKRDLQTGRKSRLFCVSTVTGPGRMKGREAERR